MTTPTLTSRWQSMTPQFLSILRIAAAFIFIQSGMMKLFGYPTTKIGGGTVALFSQMGVGGILEFFGGALLLLGFCTRPVAFILSGEMAVAYFQFHAPRGFWTLENGGGQAMLFCFLWLFISAAGAGPWSLDALRKK